jgi:hypothetical protein
VVEEASLAELPSGAIDYVGRGEPIVHGPWEPATCSAHLLQWLDRGLIQLYEVGDDTPGPKGRLVRGPDRVLSPEVCRERLLAWDRWGDDDELWACTRLVVTEEGLQGLDKAVGIGS